MLLGRVTMCISRFLCSGRLFVVSYVVDMMAPRLCCRRDMVQEGEGCGCWPAVSCATIGRIQSC